MWPQTCNGVDLERSRGNPIVNITKSGSGQFQPGYNWQTNQMSSGASYDSNGDVLSDSLHSCVWYG